MSFTARTATARWVEVAVPLPCVADDIEAAIGKARSLYLEYMGDVAVAKTELFDVKYEDGELVIYFEATGTTRDLDNAHTGEALEHLRALVTDCVVSYGMCTKHNAVAASTCPYRSARLFLKQFGT